MNFKTLGKFKLLAIFNVLIIACVFIDFYFPIEHKEAEKFDSFETDVVLSRRINDNSFGINNYVNCINGNSYFITKIPEFESEFKKNDDFNLVKTYFFSTTKAISIKKLNVLYVEDVCFLHYPINKIIYLFAFVISILSLFYSNTKLDFLLAFATVFTFALSFFYLF
ncbi:MAG: hypothetical protein ABIQ27_06075 [Flavobacterium sp.]|uniref:hypothetical protein n=1 Tax=Flavobacterium sp. TaxID=239 RepID=UPI003267A962